MEREEATKHLWWTAIGDLELATLALSHDRHDHEHAGLAHEGGEGPGGDRRACGWGCSVPNVGLLVIHYHLRGW